MTDRDLQQHIARKSFLPVYLLYGEEDFLIERRAKALAEAALDGSDPSFNHDIFRGTEHKAEEVTIAANAFPFMGEKRVVLVRESDPLLKQRALLQYVQRPSPDTVLLLCAGPLKPSRTRSKKSVGATDLLTYLREAERGKSPTGSVVEYKPLKDAEALQWIVREVEQAGRRISPEACTVVHALIGNGARELSSEIEKLLIAHPEQSLIAVEDVYDQLGASRQYNVFELANAVLARDSRRSHEILQHLLVSEEPLMIVNVLFRQLSLLWRVRSYRFSGRVTDEDARSLGLVWGWQIENVRKYVDNFPDTSYFDHCFEYILQADLGIKSQPTDPVMEVTRLVALLTAR